MAKRIIQRLMNGQYIITLPKVYVEDKGWGKGTVLDIKFNSKGNLEIEEVESRV